MPDRYPERVVFDTGVLLGHRRLYAIAAVRLGYVQGYWSPWIVSEIVRVWTEWTAERAAREMCDLAETRRRLRASRDRVNDLIGRLSMALTSIDCCQAPAADLSWLSDPDDLPVVQTVLAASADTLVSDNSADFPLGGERNGILFLSTADFLAALYQKFPDAEAAIRVYVTGEGRK